MQLVYCKVTSCNSLRTFSLVGNEGKGESLTWQGLFQGMVSPLEEPEGLQVGEGILVGSQDEEGPLLDFPSTVTARFSF